VRGGGEAEQFFLKVGEPQCSLGEEDFAAFEHGGDAVWRVALLVGLPQSYPQDYDIENMPV
jgi:hypothetical protein